MSYTINIGDMPQFNKDGFENWTNETINNMSEDYIISTDYFSYYFDSCKEYDGDDIVEIDYIDSFKDSQNYYDLEDSFYPIYNYVHILQHSPSSYAIEKILFNAPNVSILYFEQLDTYGIALNGCGMDMSDSIAYA